MVHGISTHLYLPQRLSASLLDSLRDAGAQSVEVFAARHHFDYTDRAAVREAAIWFRSNPVTATMHMPIFSAEDEVGWSRHTAPTLNLIDTSKAARIAAMDEVKRSLEAAEQVPFRSCVLHLGLRDDRWNTRSLDDSLTAIEHLKAFATPLGVQLLLENLTNSVATPDHLIEIVRVGHFDQVGFCLDLGHAHLADGTPETRNEAAKTGIDLAFEAFARVPGRLAELHVHDNRGRKDEHCWPGEGKIDWGAVRAHVAGLTNTPVATLEISYEPEVDGKKAAAGAASAWPVVEGEPER